MSKFKVGDRVVWAPRWQINALAPDAVRRIVAIQGTDGPMYRLEVLEIEPKAEPMDGVWHAHEEDLILIPAQSRPLPAATEGIKFDESKPSMSSIPKEAMWEMGQALAYGAKKYGDGNFRNGMKVSRQLSAAVRHIYQHLDGETLDAESGTTHLGHALASLAMAAYTMANHPDLDDRFEADKLKHKKEQS